MCDNKKLEILAYAVFPENLYDLFLNGLSPKCIAVVVGVGAVNGGVVVLRVSDRSNVINVRVFLDRYLHQTVGRFHLFPFGIILAAAEVPAFPINCSLEDERFSRMGQKHLLNKALVFL